MKTVARMRGALAGSACLAVLMAGTSAAASGRPVVSADIEYAFPINETPNSGLGGAARIGYEISLPFVALTPEVGGSYHGFWLDGPMVWRGFAGGRIAFGRLLRPGVFLHGGVGHLRFNGQAEVTFVRTSFTYDAGLLLDLTLVPDVELGVHASYAALLPGDAANQFDWVAVGAHLSVLF
jgi:hypothetical protein